MSFSVGIIGLPNVGKSTLFKALTKKKVDIAAYPFTTIHPNYGVVTVPDERLKKIAEIIKPEKVTPTVIEFVDIAGLVKGAHKGEGLGNQFLSHIRNCDAILEVIRAFENPDVENVAGRIEPENDIETVKIELELKDLEAKEKENLLSKKPVIYILNTDGETQYQPPKIEHLVMNLKDEEGMTELSEKEIKELGLKSQLDQLILDCYHILDLITFYTVAGGKETRAWTVKRGANAPQAGGRVHSDFEEKFIRAEVISWQKLVEAGSWLKTREKGWIRTVGREYVVQDGDVIEFRI
jgi:small GTP-binding protein